MHSEYKRIVPGAKTAVLMVHGIAGTPRHFDFLLEVIPPEVSVANILLPGHGGTSVDFAKASMKLWKQTVTGTLEQLCQTHDRVILVGHSMGTLLTALAAKEQPKVTGALYLNVPLYVYVAPRMVPASLRWCFGRLRPGELSDEGLRKAAGVRPDKRLWLYLGWLPRFFELFALCRECVPIFRELERQTMVFQSERDELVMRLTARQLRSNPSIRFTELPDCGHFCYTSDAEDQMRRAMQRLLDE